MIEGNSAAIVSLSNELTALDGQVGLLTTVIAGIKGRFDTLETTVKSNTYEMTLAFAKVAATQNQIDNLSITVDANAMAIASAEAAMDAADNELAQLNADLSALNATVVLNETAISEVQRDISVAEASMATLEAALVSLQSAVGDNTAAIKQTEEDIDVAVIKLNELDDSLAALDAMVTTTITRVGATETAISDAQAAINLLNNQYAGLVATVTANADASEEAIEALKTEISALVDAHEADRTTINTELGLLRDELSQLATTNGALAASLRSQMLALALLADSSSTSIIALQSEIATLSTDLLSHLADYDSLSLLYDQLKNHVDNRHEALSNLQTQLWGLGLLSSSLEPDPQAFLGGVYTFTDHCDVDENGHVTEFRRFFFEHPHSGTPRWIHILYANPSVNKYTEFCMKDTDDIFSVAAANLHILHSVVAHDLGNESMYRFNDNPWRPAQGVLLRTVKGSTDDYVELWAGETTYSKVRLYDGSPRYETYMHNEWITLVYGTPTTVS